MGHLHNGTLHTHKKGEILSFATAYMDLESIILNETRQSEEDKYHMISLICGILGSNKWNEIIDKIENQICREQTDSCQKREGLGSWVKKVNRLRKKTRKHIQQYDDYQRVGEGRREYKGVNDAGRRLDFGGENTI